MVVWTLLWVYFAAFFIADLIVIPVNVPQSASCSSALVSVSATGTPLLGILGWVTLVFDGIVTGVVAACLSYMYAVHE